MSGEAVALALLALGKTLTYVSFLLLLGATGVRFVVLPACRRQSLGPPSLEATGAPILRRVARTASLLLLVSLAARVYAQTYSVFGLDEPVTLELMQLVVFETRWGSQFMPQLVAIGFAVVAVLFMLVVPGAGWWAVAAGVTALAVTLPLTGHAMSHPGGAAVPWLLQVSHGLGAGLWLGTLAALLAMIIYPEIRHGPNSDAVAKALISVFSPLAVGAVAMVLVTGALTATLYFDHWSALWSTTYGLTLLGKVGLVLATSAVGAYNWRRLTPHLGTAWATRTLPRSAGLELAIASLVLVVTAVLVHLPLPHE